MPRKKTVEHGFRDLFDVAVWDHEGNVVKALWGVTAKEADQVREEYDDDPMHVVVVSDL